MHYKIELSDIKGSVTVSKAKTNRLSIRIGSDGLVKIRAPYLINKAQIINFAIKNLEWIKKHQLKAHQSLIKFKDGSTLAGIKLDLSSSQGSRNSSILDRDGVLVVKLKHGLDIGSDLAQQYIKKKLKDKLNNIGSAKLSGMLKIQSDLTGIKFNGFKNSIMKSRWGSCDNNKNIHLNSLLLVLPDDLIDYVIAHELAHTKHMNHSQQFWSLVEEIYPHHKDAKLKLKKYKIASLI